MTKSEINEQIALLLGFEKCEDRYNIGNRSQWKYPEEWESERSCVPALYVPDFVEMIKISKEIRNKFRNGLPIEFFHGN